MTLINGPWALWIDDYAEDGGSGEADSYVVFTMIFYDANFLVKWDIKLKFASHVQVDLVRLCKQSKIYGAGINFHHIYSTLK